MSNFLCWIFNPLSSPQLASPPRPSREANMTDSSTNMRLKLPIICFILEIILIILFGVLVQYDHETDAREWHNKSHSEYENDFYYRYPSECPGVDVWRFRVRGYSEAQGSRSALIPSLCLNLSNKNQWYQFVHHSYCAYMANLMGMGAFI